MLRSLLSRLLNIKAAAALAVFSISIGTRILTGYITPGFDEYEAFFIYANDIALLLFLFILTALDKRWLWKIAKALPPYVLKGSVVFVFGALFSLAFAVSPWLALYAFGRLLFAMLFALGLAAAIRMEDLAPILFAALASSGFFEALLAFGQFYMQESLGLKFLGEPLLGPLIGGAAKITVDGGSVLRSYGTLPHSNILAAVLLAAFLALSYFWLRRPVALKIWSGFKTLFSDGNLGIALFLIMLGLATTFSRSGWLAFAFATTLLLAVVLIIRKTRLQALRYFLVVCASILAIYNLLGWAIVPRSTISYEEPAVAYRLRYNDLAFSIIKKNPFGVGIGNQVLHGVKLGVYFDFGMRKRWEWQPVHNLYLLITSEIGLLGFLGFLILVSAVLYEAALNFFKRNKNLEVAVAGIMFLSFLFLGFFDHYFWTLQSGRLLLWTAFGILLGVIVRRPHSSTDRA